MTEEDVDKSPAPNTVRGDDLEPAVQALSELCRRAKERVVGHVTEAEAIVVGGWAPEAQQELQKIPFFVRGKARRNTERFAAERGVALITVETLYDAKAHFSR
mgnify:CR=1 FL=1